jgi:hypothetical protein
MIRAVIRTLSDSALYLKESVKESSGRLSVGTRDLNGSWTLTQLISSPLGLSGYPSPGKQINYSRSLPMEVISLIVAFIAASSKGRATLLKLLFVDKR